MAAKKNAEVELNIKLLQQAGARIRIIGTTPLYQNRMANKAMRELLVGGRKKTKADRADIKHDPLREFRDSADIVPGGPTALALNAIAVKASMCTAALEVPGLSKAAAQ